MCRYEKLGIEGYTYHEYIITIDDLNTFELNMLSIQRWLYSLVIDIKEVCIVQ